MLIHHGFFYTLSHTSFQPEGEHTGKLLRTSLEKIANPAEVYFITECDKHIRGKHHRKAAGNK